MASFDPPIAQRANPPFQLGATMAMMGAFDEARSVAADSQLEPFRQSGVRIVLLIELFRQGRLDESKALLAELEAEPIGAWTRHSLALAYAGREPWGGYPYPDW